MTRSILAALFAAAVLTSGAAYADQGIPAPASTGIETQTIIGVAGGETYPQFGPATAPVASGPVIALNGQQYPQFDAPDQTSNNRAYAQNAQRLTGPSQNGGFGALGDRG